jgi:hypothetical protein
MKSLVKKVNLEFSSQITHANDNVSMGNFDIGKFQYPEWMPYLAV